MRLRNLFLATVLLAQSATVPAAAAPAAKPPGQSVPTRIGACVITRVKWVGNRLEDSKTNQTVPDSGSAVEFTDRGYQVSYDQIPAVDASRRGDRVRLCLTHLPYACPPGDNRGRVYRTTNLRTGKSWELPDAEHPCGGA